MSTLTFRALYVKEQQDGTFTQEVKEVPVDDLPDHEITIKVEYSSLNYKDALSASGNRGVTQNYPHVPGIDAAGKILKDSSGEFSKGTEVIVTGKDLGSNTFGGYGEMIRVPREWTVEMPENLNPKLAMRYGTAGFTAMYGVKRLQRELIKPEGGKVIVTGATGGVGSLAVFFLAEFGYDVIAATGKMDKANFLKSLGATEVINRNEVTDVSSGFLLSRKWNGAIETVGGEMLDAVIRQTNQDGAVACCGNILGHNIETSIYPFILRGVSLLGIDSAICKMPMRLKIWEAIAAMDHHKLPEDYARTVGLEVLKDEIESILDGKQWGRVVVSHKQ